MPVHSRIELEFGNVGFRGKGKTRVHGEKPLGAEKRTNTKLKPNLTTGQENRTQDTLVGGTHTLTAMIFLLILVSVESNSQKCVCTYGLANVSMHSARAL